MIKTRNRKKYMAAWHRKNRKKAAARYQENRKEIRKKQAAYYQENCEEIKKAAMEYYKKNRKKIAKRIKTYRQKNREKLKARLAKDRRENPERFRVEDRTVNARHSAMLKRHKHQLAPRGIKGQPMSLEAHQKKLYLADGRERPCWYCLGENNETGSGLDRINNRVTYTVKNTIPACRGCNAWRSDSRSVKETRDHFKPMRDAVRRKI